MRACKCCGNNENLRKCGGCKEVQYCSKEHQKQNWKTHKNSCQFAKENPESVWIEIPPGGNIGESFRTKMIDHVFPNKDAGYRYLTEDVEEFCSRTSSPHLSHLAIALAWDLEIYVSSKNNHLDQNGCFEQSRWMRQRLSLGYPPAFEGEPNGTGIHVTRDLFSDRNELRGVEGTVFVTGRSLQTGQPINSQVLGGMLALLWQCEESDGGRASINQKVDQYKKGTWSLPSYAPTMGFEGVDVYLKDVRNAGRVVRHD